LTEKYRAFRKTAIIGDVKMGNFDIASLTKEETIQLLEDCLAVSDLDDVQSALKRGMNEVDYSELRARLHAEEEEPLDEGDEEE
jgi:hypothetical protein